MRKWQKFFFLLHKEKEKEKRARMKDGIQKIVGGKKNFINRQASTLKNE